MVAQPRVIKSILRPWRTVEVDPDFQSRISRPSDGVVQMIQLALDIGISGKGADGPISYGNSNMVQSRLGNCLKVCFGVECTILQVSLRKVCQLSVATHLQWCSSWDWHATFPSVLQRLYSSTTLPPNCSNSDGVIQASCGPKLECGIHKQESIFSLGRTNSARRDSRSRTNHPPRFTPRTLTFP